MTCICESIYDYCNLVSTSQYCWNGAFHVHRIWETLGHIKTERTASAPPPLVSHQVSVELSFLEERRLRRRRGEERRGEERRGEAWGGLSHLRHKQP